MRRVREFGWMLLAFVMVGLVMGCSYWRVREFSKATGMPFLKAMLVLGN